jgi:uncharacterized protein
VSPHGNTAMANDTKPNVALVRCFYEAVDVPAMLEFLDPQIEWRAPESLPWGGTFRGHDGVREFLRQVLDQPADFRREILEYVGAGERVVVLLRQMGRRKGANTEYDVPEVHVWTVRDGKVADFEGWFDTATVLRTLQLDARV